MRRNIVLLCCLMLALTACSLPMSPSPVTDTGSIQLFAAAHGGSADEFADVRVRLSLQGLVREGALNATSSGFVGTFDALPIGDWDVSVSFFDHDGDVTYDARGIASVRSGSTAAVHLAADARDGLLELTASIGPALAGEGVRGARLHLGSNRYTSLDPDDDDPLRFTGSRSFVPGDHEYAIGLYGEGFLAQDRIYQSPWETVRIYPGKVVHVHWDAAVGTTTIETTVAPWPDPPVDVRVAFDGDGWTVSWDPPATSTPVEYTVYVKKGDLGAYIPVETTTELMWEISESDGQEGSTWVAVTALDSDGKESFRSERAAL